METEKLRKPPASPPAPEFPPSTPSLNSSPSHEFSFTISLHPPTTLSSYSTAPLKLTKSAAPPPHEFDLSPADDIFFHGHLLPLHFLSHRPSSATIETEHEFNKNRVIESGAASAAAAASNEEGFKDRIKAKPFYSFSSFRKWLRGSEDREAEKQIKKKKKKKVFGRLWKKYASLMEEPLIFFKEMKEKREFRRSSYSFSSNCNPREGGWRRRRWRGDFSAPASMRTSPANSGLLVTVNESTMEELQNAIQAAIAHCKNSVAVKENKFDY